MENDPELSGKYLGTITKDFAAIADTLKEASYQIRKRGFSEQPIFPIAKNDEMPMGQLLVDKEDAGTMWNYNASFLDEFVQREIVGKDKEAEFKSAYKDPDEFCCLFVIDGAFTKFIFIPYPED